MGTPIGAAIGQGLGMVQSAIGIGQSLGIGRKAREKNQLDQQGKLTQQQADIQNQSQMDMWEKTNYKAQVEQLNKAGLNPGLLYGKGGGGGVTTGAGVSGGTASTPAQELQATTSAGSMGIQGMMAQKQMQLMEAQAKNLDADTLDKLKKPASTEAGTLLAGSQRASIDFQNELNKLIGTKDMAERYAWASDKIAIESQKANAEYEAWKAGGFAGKNFDDPTSPMAKAMKAGLETTIQLLEKAKLENNAKEAENIVKDFEAGLAEQGIHPHSPWWTKLITDILTKVGIADTFKKIITQ